MNILLIMSFVVSLFAIGLVMVFGPRAANDEEKQKRKNDTRSTRRIIGWVLIAVAVAVMLGFCLLIFLLTPALPPIE